MLRISIFLNFMNALVSKFLNVYNYIFPIRYSQVSTSQRRFQNNIVFFSELGYLLDIKNKKKIDSLFFCSAS